MQTLAALIRGMGASKRTQRPTIAATVPDGLPLESRVKRLTRWLRNDQLTDAVYLMPSAALLWRPLASQTLVVVVAGRVVGRGGVALRVHGVYRGRALPLAWQGRKGKKGPFPEDRHSALLEHLSPRSPAEARVVLLGDGAFAGSRLQPTVQEYGWSSGVRTGSNSRSLWDGDRCRCETMAAWIKPGTLGALREARMTEAAYGPLLLLCGWAQGSKDPRYLVTHRAAADAACRL